jgi:XRE family aerobic/anaerobic benzoate catabolism transcriptional regulator
LNREIEALSGMSVGDVIALYGQEGYRSFEARALDRVIEANDDMVLAVAGGIVSAPETYRTLLSRCRTIWLRATPEDHMTRVRAQGDERPMEGNPEAMDELRAILNARESHYAKASAVVDTSGVDETAVLERISAAVQVAL